MIADDPTNRDNHVHAMTHRLARSTRAGPGLSSFSIHDRGPPEPDKVTVNQLTESGDQRESYWKPVGSMRSGWRVDSILWFVVACVLVLGGALTIGSGNNTFFFGAIGSSLGIIAGDFYRHRRKPTYEDGEDVP